MYEITYIYNGKEYTTYEKPKKDWEEIFLQEVINCIESITRAGASIISVKFINIKN